MNPYQQFGYSGRPIKDDVGVVPMNEQNIYQSIGGNPYEQFGVVERASQPIASPKKGLFDRIGDDYQKRVAVMQQTADDVVQGKENSVGANFIYGGNMLSFGLNDAPGEILASGIKSIPAPIKQAGKYVLDSATSGPLVRPLVNAAGGVLSEAAQGYNKFKENHPRAGRYLDASAGYGSALAATLPVAKGQSIPSAALAPVEKAVVSKADEALGAAISPVSKITSEQMRETGGKLFQKATQAGAVIKPDAAASFIDDISRKILPKGKWEGAAALRSEVDDIVNNLSDLRGQPMGLDDAMALESRLGKLAYSPKNFSMGKFTPEGTQLNDIKHSLSDMIDKAADTGMVEGGPDAINAWREGQKYWSTSIRARDLERIIDNAQYFDHPATAIRTGMRALLRNPNRISKYTTQEVKAIRQAAKTGLVTDLYRLGGSGLGPIISGAVGATTGGMIGGPAGAAIGAAAAAGPSYAIREASKGMATARQGARAEKALNAVRSSVVQQKSLKLSEIMKLPPRQAKEALKRK